MRQASFASGFERFGKTTKRAKFLAEMDVIVPWQDMCKLILPHYPAGERGRPPVGVERMLRIYLMQHWFNLSDPAAGEALYDSAAMRAFVGIDLGREAAPDETTICKFRHLLEAHDVGEALLAAIKHASGQTWRGDRPRHYHGCDDHPCPTFDQERGPRARPGDAPDQEGKSVVFRDESACRHG